MPVLDSACQAVKQKSRTFPVQYTPQQYRFQVQELIRENKKLKAARCLWPWMEQTSQTVKIWAALDEYPFLCEIGHASAGKSFTTIAWYLLDWWADPMNTATVITSATLNSLRPRAWADLKRLWKGARVTMPGSLADHRYMLRSSPLDDKNAIMGIAADSEDAPAKIQGLHTKRVRVIIDEADNKFSNSIWHAIANLGSSGDFRYSAMANPDDLTSEFAQHCEPELGWGSIDIDTDHEWDSGKGCHVLRLDGLKSPNIESGENRFPFLLTTEGVGRIITEFGEHSKEYFKYVRAWYDKDASISSIFTPDLIQRMTGEPVRFYGERVRIAACDPAFDGGDRCILGFAWAGFKADEPARACCHIDRIITIKRRDKEKVITADFGDQIIELLELEGVEPDDFSIDSSGTSQTMSDYIKIVWDQGILAVNNAGAPSDRKILAEDSRLPSDRFDRFVSELWWAAREYARVGAITIEGMTKEVRIQLEGRLYDTPGKKIAIETKKLMKKRGLSSPDESDMICLMTHLIRTRRSGSAQTAVPDIIKPVSRIQAKPSVRFKKFIAPTYKN